MYTVANALRQNKIIITEKIKRSTFPCDSIRVDVSSSDKRVRLQGTEIAHISMYQQYLILHNIDLQLTIYPKLSVIFNTLSSNEFFMFKAPQGLNVYQHKLLQKNYASKPSKFKMRHLKFSNVQRCFEKGVLILPTAVNCDQIMGKGSTTLYHGRDEKLP